MSPLPEVGQNDFGAGSQLEVAPHLIDPRGFARCENGMLDDDGSIYKRGGSVKFGEAAFGTHGKFAWEGQMSIGRRTVIANNADFGVTATDVKGTAIVNLGGAGFPVLPGSAVFFQHMLFIDGGTIYGGSRKAADYSTGTVTVTKGSATVVGAGTAWVANVDPGMLFKIGAGQRIYVVKEVLGNTELVLMEAYEGATEGGHAYTLRRLEEAGTPYLRRERYAVAGERLICMEGRRLDFSEPNKPHLYKATIFPQETVVENFHELQEGVRILAGRSIGVDKLLVFHTGGITSFSSMAKSIVDGNGNSQHRIDIYSRDVVLWGTGTGIASSRTTFIIPAIDNAYLIDGVSAPVPLADSIIPRYRDLLGQGCVPGGSWVTREHLFLPILSSTGVPVDLLVCRLDKPFSYRNKRLYPWSFLAGAGALIGGAAVRHPKEGGELPRVLGMASDGQLVELLGYFNPEEANSADHDATVPVFSLLTRDFGAGDGGIHRWRKLQLFYELAPVAQVDEFLTFEELPFEGEEDPEAGPKGEGPVFSTIFITAEIGTGILNPDEPLWDVAKWDEFLWADPDEGEFDLLEGGAPPNAGRAGQLAQNEYVWFSRPRARYVRYRFTSTDPVAKLVLRGLIAFPARIGSPRHARVS